MGVVEIPISLDWFFFFWRLSEASHFLSSWTSTSLSTVAPLLPWGSSHLNPPSISPSSSLNDPPQAVGSCTRIVKKKKKHDDEWCLDHPSYLTTTFPVSKQNPHLHSQPIEKQTQHRTVRQPHFVFLFSFEIWLRFRIYLLLSASR